MKSYFKDSVNNNIREMTKIPLKRFKPIVANSINEIWQMDLFFINMMGTKVVLSVIDIYTRMGWIVKLSDKKALTVLDALKYAIKKIGGKPKIVMLDGGSEFKDGFLRYLKKQKIEVRISKGDALQLRSIKLKQAIVERFNLTMRNLIKAYLLEENKKILTQKDFDLLSEDYNNHFHSSIQATPNSIVDGNSVPMLKIRKYHIDKLPFGIGDTVRVLRQYNETFSRGRKDKTNYSKDVYEIVDQKYNKFKLNNDKWYPYTRLLKSQETISVMKEPKLKTDIRRSKRLSKQSVRKSERLKNK